MGILEKILDWIEDDLEMKKRRNQWHEP